MNQQEIKSKLQKCLSDEDGLNRLSGQISALFKGEAKRVQFVCDLYETLENKPVTKEVLEELNIGIASYYRVRKHEVGI